MGHLRTRIPLNTLIANFPLRFRPNPTAVLLAIAYAVMFAGATLFLLFFVALATQSDLAVAANSSMSAQLPTLLVAAFAVITIGLWLYSGRALRNTQDSPQTLLRATYSVGLALVLTWWIGCIYFGMHLIW